MKWNALNNIYITLIILVFLVGCVEKNTTDPTMAYRYWMGEEPPTDVQVIKARYWESPHWSKEYEIYIELNASPLWCSEFLRQNNFRRDSIYSIPDDAPSWFQLSPLDRIWQPSGSNQGSVCFEDSVSGRLLIYDVQL